MYREVLSSPPQKRIRDSSSHIVNENPCNLVLTPINKTDGKKTILGNVLILGIWFEVLIR